MSFSPSAFLTSNLSGSSSAKSRPVKFAMLRRSYSLSSLKDVCPISYPAVEKGEIDRNAHDRSIFVIGIPYGNTLAVVRSPDFGEFLTNYFQ